MTSPSRGASRGQWASTALAMAPAALPAPTTTVRPRGGAGRWRGTIWRGSAAASAARKLPTRMSRGSTRASYRRACRPVRRPSAGGGLSARGAEDGLEVAAGEAGGGRGDVLRRPLGDHAPAPIAPFGAEVDD